MTKKTTPAPAKRVSSGARLVTRVAKRPARSTGDAETQIQAFYSNVTARKAAKAVKQAGIVTATGKLSTVYK